MAVSPSAFLAKVQAIIDSKPTYRTGGSGTDGTCDCIGLIIGATRKAGGSWTGLHGSNWAARNEMSSLMPISSASLEPGIAVYKARAPGDSGYSLPDRYKTGADLLDYYHVGVVLSASPLRIAHCTSWTGGSGIKIDTSLGKWAWVGKLKKVAYNGQEGDDAMDTLWVGRVIGGRLSLRKEASTDAARLAWIAEGDTVKVLDQEAPEGWVYVDAGQLGYVMKQYLVSTEGEQDGTEDTVEIPRTLARELLAALEGKV